MGQDEIIRVLEKELKPISGKEIAQKLNADNEKRIFVLLTKMMKHNEVKCLEIPRELSMKIYNCKRRMRLYYII